MNKHSWKSIFLEEMENFNETWDDVVSCTATQEEIEREVEPNIEYDRAYMAKDLIPESIYVITSTRLYFVVNFESFRYIASLPVNFKQGDVAEELYVG